MQYNELRFGTLIWLSAISEDTYPTYSELNCYFFFFYEYKDVFKMFKQFVILEGEHKTILKNMICVSTTHNSK